METVLRIDENTFQLFSNKTRQFQKNTYFCTIKYSFSQTKPLSENDMINESYTCYDFKRKTRFLFESEGDQGKNLKMILFSHLEFDEWNLGFGDVKGGRIDDSIVSNNNDAKKVFHTVAKATYAFFDEYPNSVVVIKPIDNRRKSVYNRIFQRSFDDIDLAFHVIGVIDGHEEAYNPQKIYDNFKIMLKFGL